jgi:hypothetical protein
MGWPSFVLGPHSVQSEVLLGAAIAAANPAAAAAAVVTATSVAAAAAAAAAAAVAAAAAAVIAATSAADCCCLPHRWRPMPLVLGGGAGACISSYSTSELLRAWSEGARRPLIPVLGL